MQIAANAYLGEQLKTTANGILLRFPATSIINVEL